MPDSRNHHLGSGPDRIPSYGHQYGKLHDEIVGDLKPDETYYSKVSNKEKVDYICKALRLDPRSFHLDLPFPFEDWALSDDLSLHKSGLFFVDLRWAFYSRLIQEHPELKTSTAWLNHAEAEFWNFEFNRIIAKRRDGGLLDDPRVKH